MYCQTLFLLLACLLMEILIEIFYDLLLMEEKSVMKEVSSLRCFMSAVNNYSHVGTVS